MIFVHEIVHETIRWWRRRCRPDGRKATSGSGATATRCASTPAIDPLTGRPHYLTESTRDRKQAERILRRLLTEVDEQRATRTKATLATALDAWLRVHDGRGEHPQRLRGQRAPLHRTGAGRRAARQDHCPPPRRVLRGTASVPGALRRPTDDRPPGRGRARVPRDPAPATGRSTARGRAPQSRLRTDAVRGHRVPRRTCASRWPRRRSAISTSPSAPRLRPPCAGSGSSRIQQLSLASRGSRPRSRRRRHLSRRRRSRRQRGSRTPTGAPSSG